MGFVRRHITLLAGGTGGHIMPALAVADVLLREGHRVSWLGSIKGMEAELVPAQDIEFKGMAIKGLRGNGLLGWLVAPWRICRAVLVARRFMRRSHPDCVLSFGGFAAGPGGLAARTLGIPLVVHEQNRVPGMTNKALAKLAQKVCQGFAGSFADDIDAITVGNPVRRAIVPHQAESELPERQQNEVRILVLGGSQGARVLNARMPELLAQVVPADMPVKVHHQSGRRWIQECRDKYASWPELDVEVSDFIEDMAAAYNWADVVVARSGAMTVSELALAGVASVLVPFAYAVDDHQTLNAQVLADVGAAMVFSEAALQEPSTREVLRALLCSPDKQREMSAAAATVAKPHAAEQVVDVCLQLIDQGSATS